jgi:iron complex transport system permease protein
MTAPSFKALPVGAALVVLLVVCAVLGVSIGSTGWNNVLSTANDEMTQRILWDIRLPRTLGAALAGALLGLSGALAQGLFRNPLADPYLLGSASGASLGVATALLLHQSTSMAFDWAVRLGVTGAAFVGALLAVAFTLALARGLNHTLRLLLAGVVVGVVLAAGTSLITLLNPSMLQAMQSFTLGTTSFVGWPACVLMACAFLLCLAVVVVLAPVLDALSLGEAVAKSLGFHLSVQRGVLVVVLALASATAVAQTGLIAFVGLAAPHMVRGLTRVKHRYLLVLSSLMGAVLLTGADVLARSLAAPLELPVGILTALLGGAYLLALMYRQQTQVNAR